MDHLRSSRFSRVEADPGVIELPATNPQDETEHNSEFNKPQVNKPRSKRTILLKTGRSFKARVLSRVFSEDYDAVKNKILDPNGRTIIKWNKIFCGVCLISLFIDPLFYYVPAVSGNVCIDLALGVKIVLTVVRSVADAFYVMQIFVRFHTAYVAPSSRVFGRGELVIDSSKIALRYLRNGFLVDLIVALPIPQVLVWFVVPKFVGWAVMHRMNSLWFLIMLQYLPKVVLLFPLLIQVAEAAGVMIQKAWVGAALNLLLYLYGAHVSGACYYLLTLERQEDCWHTACGLETANCTDAFFDCRRIQDPDRVNWFQSTNVTNECSGYGTFYKLGIYGPAMQYGIGSVAFLNKYFYCLWWGLKNLSTIGQNLITSVYVGENVFVLIVGVMGLAFLAGLIGHVQRYLFSTTKRIEEWKIKRADAEQWLHQRHLPQELRQSVRKYDHYKWLATKGVDEEALVQSLPVDLQRKVKRHLCYDLVRRVPLFDQMDERMLDGICERLKPHLCTQDICLVREGDPVKQMLFIIRGQLDSYTTTDGLANSCRIGPGDFCGEELLTWALDPRPRFTFPSSTRTVKAINEVEAFALMAEDLKFVATQFRRLHSKQIRHKFRYYSHQWRTWAARTIQVAWRRHKKFEEDGRPREPGIPPPGSFWSVFAETLVASTRWSTRTDPSGSEPGLTGPMGKPEEPDFLNADDWLNHIPRLASKYTSRVVGG